MEDGNLIEPRRRRSRARAAALATTGLVVAVGGGLWIERRPIVRHFVGDQLARRGVPARYAIADLGLGRQRLTDVVIGDPAHPDLVADWIETRTDIGLSGVAVQAVRAGHVRLRARIADGRLQLGALDRLMPPSSGQPFALPALMVDVDDARVRLETPAGLVGLKIAGRGRLDDGFRGTIAAVAPRLAAAGCAGRQVDAALRIRIDRRRPVLAGPVRAAALTCGEVAATMLRTRIDATLGRALDRWQGQASLASGAVRSPALTVATTTGRIDFAGDASGTGGTLDLRAARLTAAQGRADAARLAARYRIGAATAVDGDIALTGAAVSPPLLARLGEVPTLAGTPIAPLRAHGIAALAAAGRRFDLHAQGGLHMQGQLGAVTITRADLAAASGAQLGWNGGRIDYSWPGGGARVDGEMMMAGGGLPMLDLRLRSVGRAIAGTATLRQPYAAGGASLSFTPVRFTTDGGDTRIATQLRVSGPLGDGRIDGLTLPIALRMTAAGALTIAPGCMPVAWQHLAVSGLRLDPTQLTLCPTGDALLTVADGRISGGARLASFGVNGSIGATPLALTAAGATLAWSDSGFAVRNVAVRLGRADRETRIAAATLTGRIGDGGVAGAFGGASGRIGAVPLLLSDAAGRWTLAGGALDLDGTLAVADAETAAPRFKPMAARGVTLRLAGDRITAAGTLYEPTTATPVAQVALRHQLSSGVGSADLTVPSLAFGTGFQPDLLTPLTFGVIADVKGRVTGRGRIDWGDRVTSQGQFATDSLDLAAAFGPVTGIAGTIRFDDLLGLHTPPGQVATVATVNPGIAVTDGVIRYQLLGGVRVAVEDGRWPFAGGTLTLDPTTLDFAADSARRMTFRVGGARADQFLQQFDFDNINATGVFDGELPMVFDASGGRIEQGRLAVREGGGTLAYVGVLGQKELGVWGNLAFQALRSLRYRSLTVGLNGPLAGEMVTDVRFAGISQGQGAKGNFLVRRLQRLPFVFNIRIRAPFRGLLDSAASFYDPKRLIQRNLPALIDAQNRAATPPLSTPPAIQPPVSETPR